MIKRRWHFAIDRFKENPYQVFIRSSERIGAKFFKIKKPMPLSTGIEEVNMKALTIVSLFIVPFLLLGCNSAGKTTAQHPAITTTTSPPAATSPPQVATSPIPPSTKSSIPATASPTTAPASTTRPASTIAFITAEDLYENYVKPHYDPETLITDNANYATVDARDMDSWNAAHIPDALSISPNIDNIPAGAEAIRLQLLMIPKDKLIVFYDDNLDIAPALAQQFLDMNASKHLGYDPANVKILAKGFVRWMELNYPNKNLSQ